MDADKMRAFEAKAVKMKAIAHPARLCILKGLIDKSCNVSTIQECMNMPQSTVSQHLARLKSAGIIEGRRTGLEITYAVVDREVIELIDLLFGEK